MLFGNLITSLTIKTINVIFSLLKFTKNFLKSIVYDYDYTLLELKNGISEKFNEYHYSTFDEKISLFFLKESDHHIEFLKNPDAFLSKRKDLICSFTSSHEITKEIEKFVYYFNNTDKDIKWRHIVDTLQLNDNISEIDKIHIIHALSVDEKSVLKIDFDNIFQIISTNN